MTRQVYSTDLSDRQWEMIAPMLPVAKKELLARFGFDLFNWMCQQLDCELIVLNSKDLSPESRYKGFYD